NRPSTWYSVEFNHIHKCWYEVLPNNVGGTRQWNVVQPCPDYYECNILVSELVTREEEGPLDGESPSETSSEGGVHDEPSDVQITRPIMLSLIVQHITAQLAESHLNTEPTTIHQMAMVTAEEITIMTTAPINQETGHR